MLGARFCASHASANPAILGMRTISALSTGEVHLWRLDLAGDAHADAARTLTRDELDRANRFVFDRDRHRFMRGRIALRSLLARYLDLDPQRLPLAKNAHGKPMLDPAYELGFNLSHSGDIGLVAISRAAAVGVDIEETCTEREMRPLAASLFSRQEMASIDSFAEEALTVPFLTCWTRKEACLKALGVGLALDPHTFHVGTGTNRCRVYFADRSNCEYVEVSSVVQDDRCVAAVAVIGGFTEVKFCDFDERQTPLYLE